MALCVSCDCIKPVEGKDMCSFCIDSHDPRYKDLYSILPDVKIDFENFWECEKNVLTPALIELGYRVNINWYSQDQDSFGPLVRAVNVTGPDSKEYILVYG